MNILGLSAYYHDSAACLVVDGRIVAAAQEERFTRIKQDKRFPTAALRYCLAAGGLHPKEIDHVVFYEKPRRKLNRLLSTYLAVAPRGFESFGSALSGKLGEKVLQKKQLAQAIATALQSELDWEAKLLFSEHHFSHAASAFYPSPFERAAVLTMDGVGEWATTTVAVGKGSQLAIEREIRFPHSLGLLYAAITSYTGFKVNSGEYKVMGLAPYGRPIYADAMREHLVDVRDDGSFHLDMRYFDYCAGFTMTSPRLHALFGGPPRAPESLLTQKDMDLAASIQQVTEEVVLKLGRDIARSTGEKHLCLAGGVALNCVANGKLLRDGSFEKLWIQPAAGDAGGALGAALAAHYAFGAARHVNPRDDMRGAYLGPEYPQAEIEAALTAAGAVFTVVPAAEIPALAARALADGAAVGWHQGRMEFGPRALGARSILGDPRSPEMQRLLNLKVKFRESFRPFAPSVLREDLPTYFDLDVDSPYMLLVADVAPARQQPMTPEQQALFGIDKLNVVRSDLPAVTHVDYSARIQTVHADTNPRYHALLTAFKALTGCPVLVNTSFNVRGEPIVCTPQDAWRCFMGTGIEWLVIGNCVLKKTQQTARSEDYTAQFEND